MKFKKLLYAGAIVLGSIALIGSHISNKRLSQKVYELEKDRITYLKTLDKILAKQEFSEKKHDEYLYSKSGFEYKVENSVGTGEFTVVDNLTYSIDPRWDVEQDNYSNANDELAEYLRIVHYDPFETDNRALNKQEPFSWRLVISDVNGDGLPDWIEFGPSNDWSKIILWRNKEGKIMYRSTQNSCTELSARLVYAQATKEYTEFKEKYKIDEKVDIYERPEPKRLKDKIEELINEHTRN